jgi:hypothetical protein
VLEISLRRKGIVSEERKRNNSGLPKFFRIFSSYFVFQGKPGRSFEEGRKPEWV